MLNAGQILQDRYQLQQRLGRTAAGRQTWLSLDLQSNESITVKLLAFSPEMHWEELKLFEREAQVLQALQHPRIPRYRDYFSLDRETTGLPWFGLVQDYIPGSSFQELLEQGRRFTESQVKKIATDLLEILLYLHELSPPVLHRDIKPSNLILGEDQQVYLVDFGAVQAQAAVTGVTFTVVGTSGYAPLEQFWGRAVPASDLYALGATLIHLLTGTSPANLPQKDSRIQFSHLVSLKPTLVQWIEKLTEIALEKRFSSAKQALSALQSTARQATPESAWVAKKVLKPDSSRIQLFESATDLKIHIPSKLVRTPFKTILMVFPVIAITSPYIINYFLFSGANITPPGIVTLIVFISLIGRVMGSGRRIVFNQDSFEISYQVFGWTYLKRAGFVDDILGFFLHGGHCGEHQIKLRCENHHSEIKSYLLADGLKDRESAWLAQELQEWLNRN